MPRFEEKLEKRCRRSSSIASFTSGQTRLHRRVDDQLLLQEHLQPEKHLDEHLGTDQQQQQENNRVQCAPRNRGLRTCRGVSNRTNFTSHAAISSSTSTQYCSTSYPQPTSSIHGSSASKYRSYISCSSLIHGSSTSSHTFYFFRGREIFAFVFLFFLISAFPDVIKVSAPRYFTFCTTLYRTVL